MNLSGPQKAGGVKKAKLILPWEIQSLYSIQLTEPEDEEDDGDDEEQNEARLARLISDDEHTRDMTREEYVYWSECRLGSFTFRKAKRFREWASIDIIINSKPNDDIMDVLGFLTSEMVQTLTREALQVKAAEDLRNHKTMGEEDEEMSKKRERMTSTLFEMPKEDKTPLAPKHIREAFRRTQVVPPKYMFMRQGFSGTRTPLRLI